MGRVPPGKHSRAVAQMCDLLDAAACVAGVPLLALDAVREKSGEINPKAWKNESGPRRDAIIKRSQDHQFLREDLEAISSALDDLGKRGNTKAWAYVKSLYPGDLLYKRLIADYADAIPSAIDDLGTDSPDRTQSETWSYARDPRVRSAVLKRANGQCEFCDKLGFMNTDGTRYLECRIESLDPDTLVIIEWPERTEAWAAAQCHGDPAGGFGGYTGSSDGGYKGALADVACEEDLVDARA